MTLQVCFDSTILWPRVKEHQILKGKEFSCLRLPPTAKFWGEVWKFLLGKNSWWLSRKIKQVLIRLPNKKWSRGEIQSATIAQGSQTCLWCLGDGFKGVPPPFCQISLQANRQHVRSFPQGLTNRPGSRHPLNFPASLSNHIPIPVTSTTAAQGFSERSRMKPFDSTAYF